MESGKSEKSNDHLNFLREMKFVYRAGIKIPLIFIAMVGILISVVLSKYTLKVMQIR